MKGAKFTLAPSANPLQEIPFTRFLRLMQPQKGAKITKNKIGIE